MYAKLQHFSKSINKEVIYSAIIGYTIFNIIFYGTLFYCFLELNLNFHNIKEKAFISLIPIGLFGIYYLQQYLFLNKNYILYKILNNCYMFGSFFVVGFLSAHILSNITLSEKLFFERFMLFYSLIFFIINLLSNLITKEKFYFRKGYVSAK